MAKTLLIIEDEPLLGSELQRHYRKQGMEAIWVQTCADARRHLQDRRIDPLLVLSDLNLPDGNGLGLLEEQINSLNACEWVFLTGYGDVPDSVRALRLGAFDFLTKPCPMEKLDMTVHSALRSALAQRRLLEGSLGARERYSPEIFIGECAIAVQVRNMLSQLSQLPFNGLILSGETGTGKGLAVRILHYNSHRASEPLVELNCAALPRELLESELFGHEAGAFTGAKGRHRGLVEQANRGTLFLDEIGEMPLDLQAKLLKVLEDHKVRRLGGEQEINVDLRIVAATNRNLPEQVRQGQFRADLYHRLSMFELRMPTLLERISDLRELVAAFLAEFNNKLGKQVNQISPQGWAMLESYSWPGNVRELRNVLERCVMLSHGNLLPEQWLQLNSESVTSTGGAGSPGTASVAGTPQAVPHEQPAAGDEQISFPLDGSMGLDDMNGEIIRAMLSRHQGNVMEVARMLKTTREKIRYRIEKLQIRR